jgi:hypothetical protein
MQAENMQPTKIQPEHQAYLLAQGAGTSAHSGRTLWAHLEGVHRILQVGKFADYVCAAGLFHSVYGTQAFKTVTVEKTRRAEVQQLIGEKAESLVMAFCELPRPKLFEATLQQGTQPLPEWMAQLDTTYDKPQFLADLLALECANLAEQRTLHAFPKLAQHAQAVGILDREGFLV